MSFLYPTACNANYEMIRYLFSLLAIYLFWLALANVSDDFGIRLKLLLAITLSSTINAIFSK